MARWSSLKDILILAISKWRLWLLQFFGNAIVILAWVWWLRLPDAHWWQLLFQMVLVIAAALAACILHGGTLHYFHAAHQDRGTLLAPALRGACKHVVAILVWAVIVFLLWGWIGDLHKYDIRLPGYLRSEFPAWLRHVISESAMDNAYGVLVSFLRWVILPGLLLPFALFTADKGFRGLISFREWWRSSRGLAYWLVLLVAAILGVYCVDKIMRWTLDPKTATLAAEKTSLVLRMFCSYLLVLLSWLVTCSLVGRALVSKEPVAQPK